MRSMASRRRDLDYAFKYLPDHLFQSNDWDKLVLLFEKRNFLAKKANTLETLNLSEDLEKYLLPALRAKGHWICFSQFALVAANLRGLYERLANETLLPSVVRGVSPVLASEICRQITHPAKRAATMAILTRVFPSQEMFSVERVIEDIRRLPPSDSPRERDAVGSALHIIAENLGSTPKLPWEAWLERFMDYPHSEEVLETLALDLLVNHRPESKLLDETHTRMRDPVRMASTLLDRLFSKDYIHLESLSANLTQTSWKRFR